MTHEDIVQESKKYWQQMEAHASKPTNSMVRCISGLQPGFAPNCSSTFSLFSSHYYALCLAGPSKPGWPQRRRTAVSFLFCSACDDLCTLFISIISAQFGGGEKPSEQKGQHTEWCFLQHFASETERRWGSCPRTVGIKEVLLPFSGQGMIWPFGRTVRNDS